jgi:dynein heavy chain
MTIDDQWKKITNFYCEKKLISEITKNKDIVKSLQNCQKNIEVVQKGLYSYFDSKRMSFPRFFFLSDDELLEILSQKK